MIRFAWAAAAFKYNINSSNDGIISTQLEALSSYIYICNQRKINVFFRKKNQTGPLQKSKQSVTTS